MAGDGNAVLPTTPPDAGRLGAIDDDLWRQVVVHLRRSLAEAGEEDPRVRRLGTLPVSRLLGGRARRDAVAALAAGGPLWMALRRRVLADAELARSLGQALGDDVATAAAAPAAPSPAGPDPADLDRLRDRVRRLREERDAARRRADGETARADREASARRDAEAALAEAHAEVEGLRAALEAAADQRTAAVERERRRGEATLAEVNEQLRQVRREHQERARRQRAADRAEEVAAARPAPPRADPGPTRLVPGRPSRLPNAVHPDTTEAVDLLLHAGRLVLVDGYNVTRSHRADLDLESQRRWLVNLVAGAAAARRIEPHVIFDGHATDGPGSSRRERGVVVVFTPQGVTADDDLVFEVEAADPARPITVVTDDRELRERLAPYRVDLVSTGGFLGALR